jgi:quercetin dioxygenase-like cupin family protein
MIIRNYTGADGKSRFEEIPPTFEAYAGVRESTALQEVMGFRFVRWPAGLFLDWYNAPRRQYVIVLAGQVEVGVADETRRLEAGDVALEEELTGQGHTARVVGDHPLLLAIVPLEGESHGDPWMEKSGEDSTASAPRPATRADGRQRTFLG